MRSESPVEAMSAFDPSLAHFLGRLAAVEGRVQEAIADRRATDPAWFEPARRLGAAVDLDRLLRPPSPPARPSDGLAAFVADVEARADGDEAGGHRLRLRRLAAAFGLLPMDVDLLLVALAPEVDLRFEGLFSCLQGPAAGRPTVQLALELSGLAPESPAARSRLRPGGPLVDGSLVRVGAPDRPFLGRPLDVSDRVVMHLLGDDEPDADLRPFLLPPGEAPAGLEHEALAAALERGVRLVHLQEPWGGQAAALAAGSAAAAGRPPLALDGAELAGAGPDGAVRLAGVAGREARLIGGAIVLAGADELAAAAPAAIRAFAGLPVPVLLASRAGWNPAWSRDVPLTLAVPPPSRERLLAVWRRELDGCAADELDLAEVTSALRLSPAQAVRAARSARLQAGVKHRAVAAADVAAGVRAQNGAALERLAERRPPVLTWDDLILPQPVLGQLHRLVDSSRWLPLVSESLRLGGPHGRRGIAALFTGPSGTGKTTSAEVVASALGLDLYVVNLAMVVDKYIGETEKNLERIFSEAEGVSGVLFFDEADALFGKRSEVSDARDRYANIETAYLLQRMERFDGIAILATNLRSNLDEAFTRRLDGIVEFPLPDPGQRERLWSHFLGRLPLEPDVDVPFCARAFALSGGSIYAIALWVAMAAAGGGRPATMADVVQAVAAEYRKLGRLCHESEFGPYSALLDLPASAPRFR